MITDNDLLFSNSQALTADAASTNVIDLGANRGLDRSGLRIRAVVTEAFAGGTSLVTKVQTDDNSSFSSATDIHTAASIATAALTLGAVILDIPFPANAEDYIRLYYDVTGSYTAGKVEARIVGDTPITTTYADETEHF